MHVLIGGKLIENGCLMIHKHKILSPTWKRDAKIYLILGRNLYWKFNVVCVICEWGNIRGVQMNGECPTPGKTRPKYGGNLYQSIHNQDTSLNCPFKGHSDLYHQVPEKQRKEEGRRMPSEAINMRGGMRPFPGGRGETLSSHCTCHITSRKRPSNIKICVSVESFSYPAVCPNTPCKCILK